MEEPMDNPKNNPKLPTDSGEKAGPKDGAVASATVTVDALGSVSVVGDSTPQGQGHQTALAQIVADELGLHYRDIAVNLETDLFGKYILKYLEGLGLAQRDVTSR